MAQQAMRFSGDKGIKMFNIKKRIDELELESSSNSKVFCELYSEIRSLKGKYLTLKTAIVGLGRKLGVELVLDEEDEQIKVLDGIVNGNNKTWTTPEDLNKEE